MLAVIPFIYAAAQAQKFDLGELARKNALSVANRTISPITEGPKSGIRFSGQEGDGVAWINGIEFSNGTVEMDLRGKDVLQQSFIGLAFHGSTGDSLEAIYFRPFNFRATDSTRHSHAVEYVFHPAFPWDRLRREHPGVYEKEIPNAPDPNHWFHVKITIAYPQVTVYVNGDPRPCLVVTELSTRRLGKLGLWVGNNSDGDFANLQLTHQ